MGTPRWTEAPPSMQELPQAPNPTIGLVGPNSPQIDPTSPQVGPKGLRGLLNRAVLVNTVMERAPMKGLSVRSPMTRQHDSLPSTTKAILCVGYLLII